MKSSIVKNPRQKMASMIYSSSKTRFFGSRITNLQMKEFTDKNSFETFYAKDLEIKETKSPVKKPDFNKPLPFGVFHSDHLLEVDYNEEHGWENPVISPYHKFEIDPSNSSLHYAIQLFEGMKAYRNVKNQEEIMLFRPEMNMSRLLKSAERIGLPKFRGEEFITCIEKLVSLDREWVPYQRGYSLYIRPTFISMTNQLGVIPPREAKLYTMLSPVGPYFPTGFNAIKIVCSENIMRSWPGGFGYAKLGANYGPTLEYYKQIKERGFQQILWLINETVTEVGVMNFFIFWVNKQGEKELITCPLDGTILPGIMRDSVITVCKEWDIKVSERHYTINDVIDAIKEDRLLEAFGTGTAAIICPVKEISYKDTNYEIFKDKNQEVGELGKRLYNYLLDIQTGVIKHPWSRSIKA